MSVVEDEEALREVARRVAPGARLTGVRTLRGGVSASVHALELALPGGGTREVVVRRHGALAWKPLESDVIATEHALLEALVRAGFEVPRPCLLDVSRAVLPSPYFVMELVPGTTAVDDAALPDALRRMADFLRRLHALDVTAADLPPLPAREDPIEWLRENREAVDLDRELDAALSSRGLVRANPPALLHGDFWPENILWRDGRIAAVVDWEDAAIGDPLTDLATCRLELLWRYGEDAMEAFTAAYLDHHAIDTRDLPVWELFVSSAALASLAHWGLDPRDEEARRREGEQFRARARRDVISRD